MKCKFCEAKIKKGNEGICDWIDNGERRRFLKLKKNENICMECKTQLLMLNIISPW